MANTEQGSPIAAARVRVRATFASKLVIAQVVATIGLTSCGGRVAYETSGGYGGNATAGTASAGAMTIVDSMGTPAACHSAEFIEQHALCGPTKSGAAIAKNVPCTAEDTQSCYVACGVMGLGYKLETCVGGVYTDNGWCMYDPGCDYSCFKLPDKPDPGCPTTEPAAPRHLSPCSLPPCVVCGVTSTEATTGFRDAAQGMMKVGPCICVPAGIAADGIEITPQRWSCNGGSYWPCKIGTDSGGLPGC